MRPVPLSSFWVNLIFKIEGITLYQDIVWLDVSVEDVASFEQLEGQEELLTVGAHSLDVEPNVFSVFLQHLSQIHTTNENIAGYMKVNHQINKGSYTFSTVRFKHFSGIFSTIKLW